MNFIEFIAETYGITKEEAQKLLEKQKDNDGRISLNFTFAKDEDNEKGEV